MTFKVVVTEPTNHVASSEFADWVPAVEAAIEAMGRGAPDVFIIDPTGHPHRHPWTALAQQERAKHA